MSPVTGEDGYSVFVTILLPVVSVFCGGLISVCRGVVLDGVCGTKEPLFSDEVTAVVA